MAAVIKIGGGKSEGGNGRGDQNRRAEVAQSLYFKLPFFKLLTTRILGSFACLRSSMINQFV
ncbi:MAG: hypothetical protein DA408_02730 [Bacteroidetes bacterium]|nr:MAG: hypothetical protein C7N36_07195 [Bacteroidota bacterium]PTM14515.1 MAG: hypothetical protein DA408_02730 [Bacteroidota bacterium]